MKAIYKRQDILCVVVEEYGDHVILEPVDGNEDQQFSVSLGDENLILDPTDDEVFSVERSGLTTPRN